MSINIKVIDDETSEPTPAPSEDKVTITVAEKDRIEAKLKLRSAINGDLMIMDHKDIDIVISQKDKKITAFAKDTLSDMVYGAESRLLEYLRRNGLIQIDSIQGGNIYGSLEAKLQDAPKVIEVSLMKIAEWMEEEGPMMSGRSAYDEMEDEHLLQPDNEFSTELGEVPQAEEKGSIVKSNLFAPYMYGRYTY
jgi:hypothetical protein